METRKEKRKAYLKLKTAVVVISGDEYLLRTSLDGGHHSADDDETLGAKEFNFFNEEEVSSASKD